MVSFRRAMAIAWAAGAGVSLCLALLAGLGWTVRAVWAATRVITSAADGGPGTLRQALLDAGPGDTLTFDAGAFPPGAPAVIRPTSPLPAITQDNLTIDASNAGVILDGGLVPSGTVGLSLQADGVTVRGLTVRGFPSDGLVVGPGAAGNVIGGDRAVGAGPNGQGNRFSGNGGNGLMLRGAGTSGNLIRGNFIGVDATGMNPDPNTLSGLVIWQGASDNIVGGAAGARNVISGNRQNGLYINGAGTDRNRLLGNFVGPNATGFGVVGQLENGVVINGGASQTVVGDGTAAGRNVISGNALVGVLIADPTTVSNTVQGNYHGANLNGTGALPNGLHGVEIRNGAHHNLIGGNRLLGLGNLLSGNANHGLVVDYEAHHNQVLGNLIGPDASGSYSLGNQPFGGIDVAEGAQFNQIGGLGPGEGNLISGNGMDGIALYSNLVTPTADNQLLGNLIGLDLAGAAALPNGGDGVFNVSGAARTLILSNTVAYNAGAGVFISDCTGNTAAQNAIFANGGPALRGSCLAAPQVTVVSTATLTGTAIAGARVHLYADDEDEAARYLGAVLADAAGAFTYTAAGGLPGPNLTALYTDTFGNTSVLAPAVHTAWTLLLYLNGDNDLEDAFRDTLAHLAAAGPSPRANVLALMDGYTTSAVYSGTQLFDLSAGTLQPLTLTLGSSGAVPGELNLGAGGTLADFVAWGRARYPSRYTLLSVVDHGGGWAPNPGDTLTHTLSNRIKWMAGQSGLSWDFTSDFDHMTIGEVQQALSITTGAGAQPVDVVFFDVCLMGMAEVAYQIRDYADYFVSSQNLGWAPVGPQNRYVRLVHGLPPAATPRDLAGLLVSAYAAATPPSEHPFTVSAVDLGQMPALAGAVAQLGAALSQTLTGTVEAQALLSVYSATQKIDYDGDLVLEPATDGFVDLYDFAARLAAGSGAPAVRAAAAAVTTAVSSAVVAEAHRSGAPWARPAITWTLDDAHGLSIFLPFGEDLEFPLTVTVSAPGVGGLASAGSLRLRETYIPEQLDFVAATGWNTLIDRYYTAVATPVITGTPDGPVKGLQSPDVTAPTTAVTVTTQLPGRVYTFTWATRDDQSGLAVVSLWRRVRGETWEAVGPAEALPGAPGQAAGQFVYATHGRCEALAVLGQDAAGNLEAARPGDNVFAPLCLIFLPTLGR